MARPSKNATRNPSAKLTSAVRGVRAPTAATEKSRKARSFQSDRTVGEEQWHTPKYIPDALGPFGLDPCAPPAHQRPWKIANKVFTAKDDGLASKWPAKAHAFLNPPYGEKTGPFLEKASQHPGGGIALVFARTDTKWCQQHVFGKATAVLFIAGRIRFCRDDGSEAGSAGAPSMLVAYGVKAAERLQSALAKKKLKGTLVLLGGANSVIELGSRSANDGVKVAA